jgi:hypothetical protein
MSEENVSSIFGANLPPEDVIDERDTGLPCLSEGEVDPFLNKKVKVLIVTHELYNVYLDELFGVQWYGRVSDDKEIGSALNKVSKLESNSHFITDSEILRPIRQQIAEGLVRAFEGHKELSAEMFKQIEKEISLRNIEISWRWYFLGAAIPTAFLFALLVVLWVYRGFYKFQFGGVAFTVALGALVGSLGAFLSISSRSTKFTLDARAGLIIHVTEGLARIITGLLGGAFVVLVSKGGIAFSGLKASGNSLAALLSFCLIAGASERLIPNLVKKHENELK